MSILQAWRLLKAAVIFLLAEATLAHRGDCCTTQDKKWRATPLRRAVGVRMIVIGVSKRGIGVPGGGGGS